MARSRLGELAIESKLGDHPSQSSVWRAIHVKQKRAVAAKIFATPFGGTPEARAQFASEWKTLQALSHPAIAKCFGGGFEESDAYLAYELIEGETLAAQLARRSRLAWENVLEMAEPLVDAIEYLHGRGLIYGALQPDKVLFAGLSPVLIDVRADRVASPYRTPHPPTQAELAMLPPEVAKDPSAMSTRGDLYMLGALLYLSVTGRPPISGETIEEVSKNIASTMPPTPATIVLDCPIWLDKLIMQLLEKDPSKRPLSASGVKLALGEVRRRAMSRTGVAEHASSGFSALRVTDQDDLDTARKLLGRDDLTLDDETPIDDSAWHDQPLVLIAGLAFIGAVFAYVMWPLNENDMRGRAEKLLATKTHSSMKLAQDSFLEPMIEKFPHGKHTLWAREQIDEVEMLRAEHALEVKIKRNFPLKDEAERLYAEATRYERFGDTATALDQYRSLITLLGDNPDYRPFVNLAHRQIGLIESSDTENDEATRILQVKLEQAQELHNAGKTIAAKKIWYSVVELYGKNEKVAPLVAKAQAQLEGNGK